MELSKLELAPKIPDLETVASLELVAELMFLRSLPCKLYSPELIFVCKRGILIQRDNKSIIIIMKTFHHMVKGCIHR